MALSNRVYVYGIGRGGIKEFLHTFLDREGAVSYIHKHRKLFGSRFHTYFYTSMGNGAEHYVE